MTAARGEASMDICVTAPQGNMILRSCHRHFDCAKLQRTIPTKILQGSKKKIKIRDCQPSQKRYHMPMSKAIDIQTAVSPRRDVTPNDAKLAVYGPLTNVTNQTDRPCMQMALSTTVSGIVAPGRPGICVLLEGEPGSMEFPVRVMYHACSFLRLSLFKISVIP